MRKSVVIGIAAVLALLIVAGFFLFDRGGAPAPLDIGGHEDTSGAAPRRVADRGPEAAPSAASDVQPITTTRFVETDIRAARTVEDDTLRVLVLEEPTGLPAPGVEVAWMDDQPPDMDNTVPLSGPPAILADFDAVPHRTTTDSTGIAVIRSSPKLVVAARRGDVFGMRKFTTAPRGEVRVVMTPGPMIAARVVTASGEPAPGVAVYVTVSQGKGKRDVSQRRVISRSPDGLAIADHPSLRPEVIKGAAFEVTARLEDDPKKVVTVPIEKLKEGPITLVLDQAGRIFVKLIGPDGKPLAGDARVWLDTARGERRPRYTQFRGVAHAGTAEFPFVPIGAPMKVTVDAPGFDSVANQPVNELRSPGEEQTVEVRLRKKQAVLVGRAVDESGNPLGQKDFAVDVAMLGKVTVLSVPDRAHSDAAGGIRIPIDRQLFGEGGCEISLEIESGRDRIERSGSVTVPSVSDGEETQIGDIRLVRPDVLVSGTVVDENGVPLADALVNVVDSQFAPGGGKPMAVGNRGLNRPPPAIRLRARSDSSGAFEIPVMTKSRARVTSMGLSAELQGYVCRERTKGVQAGARDAKVVLHGTGNIQGSLLLPTPAPIRRIELMVTRSDLAGPEGQKKQRFEDCVDSDGRFLLTGIVPGTVTVAVRVNGVVEPLKLFSDVAVPRLGVADDARLKQIDLQNQPALTP